jgi:hypothetical protein
MAECTWIEAIAAGEQIRLLVFLTVFQKVKGVSKAGVRLSS